MDSQLRRDTQQAVERGIAKLPLHFRMPLVLKEIVELPIAKVAAILGLRPATVKTRVHRGRLLLRREFARDSPTQDVPAADHSRQLCLDLLQAKQESLDRGVPFKVPSEDLCGRCQEMFATLDLIREICEIVARAETSLRADGTR